MKLEIKNLNYYHKLYQKNPKSKIFASLAECYRSRGLIDEALKILMSGIQDYPHFTYAKIILARCYQDLKEYYKAFELLKPYLEENTTNFAFLNLFLELALKIQAFFEAEKALIFLKKIDSKNKFLEEKLILLKEKNEIRTKKDIESFYMAENRESRYEKLEKFLKKFSEKTYKNSFEKLSKKI